MLQANMSNSSYYLAESIQGMRSRFIRFHQLFKQRDNSLGQIVELCIIHVKSSQFGSKICYHYQLLLLFNR